MEPLIHFILDSPGAAGCGLLLVVALIYILSNCLVVVPPNTVMFATRFGRDKRQLESGMHLLLPFADSLVMRRWRRIEEESRGRVVDSRREITQFPTNTGRYDLPPVRFTSKDQVYVTVNTVANYRSINSEKMVFSTDDVMQSMITEVISKFQQAISHMTTLECLQGCQVAANDSVPLINEALARFGIMIEQLIVEEVAIPDAIAEKNLQIITAQRTAQAKRETSTAQFELDRQSRHNQHELQMAQERHARDLRAAELERERLENEHHQRLEEVNAKTRATIIGMEVASEADRTVRMAEADLAARKKQSEGEASRYASLIKAGVTMQDLVSLEQVKAAGMLAQNANVMYLPNELVVPSLWGGLGPMGGSGVGPATRSRAKAMAAVGVPSAPTDK